MVKRKKGSKVAQGSGGRSTEVAIPLLAVAAGSATGNKPIAHIRHPPVTVQMASPQRATEGAMKKDEQSKQQRLKGAQELCLLRGRVERRRKMGGGACHPFLWSGCEAPWPAAKRFQS